MPEEKILTLKPKYENYCTEEYVGKITKDMDTFLTYKSNYNYSYLLKFDQVTDGYVWSIRVPGATRGHVKCDKNMVITEVEFYKNTCYEIFQCFDPALESIKDKYIGYKIMIE